MAQATCAEWLDSLPQEQRHLAYRLLEKFCEIGPVRGVAKWVRSEVSDGIPQFARYSLLKSIRETCIEYWIEESNDWILKLADDSADPDYAFKECAEVLIKLHDARVTQDELGNLARFIAFTTASMILKTLDEKTNLEVEHQAPRWMLMEVDSNDNSTGRHLGNLSLDLTLLEPLPAARRSQRS